MRTGQTVSLGGGSCELQGLWPWGPQQRALIVELDFEGQGLSSLEELLPIFIFWDSEGLQLPDKPGFLPSMTQGHGFPPFGRWLLMVLQVSAPGKHMQRAPGWEKTPPDIPWRWHEHPTPGALFCQAAPPPQTFPHGCPCPSPPQTRTVSFPNINIQHRTTSDYQKPRGGQILLGRTPPTRRITTGNNRCSSWGGLCLWTEKHFGNPWVYWEKEGSPNQCRFVYEITVRLLGAGKKLVGETRALPEGVGTSRKLTHSLP